MATSPVSSTPNEIFAGTLTPFLSTQEPWQNLTKRPTSRVGQMPIAPAPVESAATREQTLLANLPLVRFVARRIHERLPQHVELEDLVGAGIVGLIDAFNKFDAGKKIQFRTYAQFRIRGAILDSLRSLDWGSRELRRKGRSIEEATQKLTHRWKRRPSESEVAAELNMPLSEYQQLLGELRSLEIGSLQEAHVEGSVEEELAYVPTSAEEDPLYRCMKKEDSTHLSAAIAELPEREARVLALYYVEEMTLKEIGVVLGLVESRVSQIRAAAVIALRGRLAQKRKAVRTQPTIPAAVIERSAAAAQPRIRRIAAVHC